MRAVVRSALQITYCCYMTITFQPVINRTNPLGFYSRPLTELCLSATERLSFTLPVAQRERRQALGSEPFICLWVSATTPRHGYLRCFFCHARFKAVVSLENAS
jgi:hypothetical protein